MTEAGFKGGWHQAMALSFGVMAAYNLMRVCATHRRRNLINVLLYVPLCVHELRQARHHWSPPRA